MVRCFACHSSTLVRPGERTSVRPDCSSNKKWALNCCHRKICTECLDQFGSRLSSRKECVIRGQRKAKRPEINDKYNAEVQRWIEFCRSGCYTFKKRLAHARKVTNNNALTHPPKQKICQSLDGYSDLKCPFCARKPVKQTNNAKHTNNAATQTNNAATHLNNSIPQTNNAVTQPNITNATQPNITNATQPNITNATQPRPNAKRKLNNTNNTGTPERNDGKQQRTDETNHTDVPLQYPLPSVVTKHTGLIKYRRLGNNGTSPFCETNVRVVEFQQVIDASSQKGRYAPFEVVADSRRHMSSATKENVEWTLLWTRHRHDGDSEGEHQLLSMIHHNGWRYMFEKYAGTSNDVISRAVYQGTVDDMGSNTHVLTSKRSGGSGGPLSFISRQVAKTMSLEVGRTEVWFVQISSTSAMAMYISPLDLKGSATICGNAARGGESNPTLASRDGGSELYAHFLDGFSRGRINAARLVGAVNKKLNLSIAFESIEKVEEQWLNSIAEVMAIDEAVEGVPLVESELQTVQHKTRRVAAQEATRSRSEKHALEKQQGGSFKLHGDKKKPLREEELLATVEKRATNQQKQRACCNVCSYNENTMVCDPVGGHLDTGLGRQKCIFENKAVFCMVVNETNKKARVQGTAMGGILFFPDIGCCTVCQPNVDVEYHCLGSTWHCVSEPKFMCQGRGGGSTNEFCFAICDHPKRLTPRAKRAAARNRSLAKARKQKQATH